MQHSGNFQSLVQFVDTAGLRANGFFFQKKVRHFMPSLQNWYHTQINSLFRNHKDSIKPQNFLKLDRFSGKSSFENFAPRVFSIYEFLRYRRQLFISSGKWTFFQKL